MLFKSRFHPGLRGGSIDRSYRRWKGPKVKVGGLYRFGPRDAVEVTAIESVAARKLTRSAARRSGFDSVEELRREIEKAGRRPLADSDELTCVAFRYQEIEPQTKAPATTTPAEVDEIVDRIRGMERRSKSGPWVWEVLALIADHPRRRAGDLAEMLGAETQPFKSRIRRLKAMGLTESFEVGYALTALGKGALGYRSIE